MKRRKMNRIIVSAILICYALTGYAQEMPEWLEGKSKLEAFKAQCQKIWSDSTLNILADDGSTTVPEIIDFRVIGGGNIRRELKGDIYKIDSLVVNARNYMPQNQFPALNDMAFWGAMTVLDMRQCRAEGDSIPAYAFTYFQPNKAVEQILFSIHEIYWDYGDWHVELVKPLKRILFPKNLKQIGEGAFLHSGHKPLEGTLELPEGLEKIGDIAFADNEFSGTLQFPTTLKEIGEECFAGNQFNKVILPEQEVTYADHALSDLGPIEEIVFPEGITSINANGLFYHCDFSKMQQLVLPETLTNLGKWTFSWTGIKSIRLPQGIQKIDDGLLNGCPITEIDIPQNVDFIGIASLAWTKLQEITIPDNVSTIRSWAFQGCDQLKKVILPANLSYIEKSAFDYCLSLVEVHARNATPPTVGESTGTGKRDYIFMDNKKAVLYVPQGARQAYLDDPYWGPRFGDVVEEAPVEIQAISEEATQAYAEVYDIDGRPFGKVKITDGRPDTSSLRSGVYVIRMGEKATKVVVR